MPTFKPKILVVDDEEEARTGLARSLRSKGYDVLEAATGGEVVARAKAEWPALIILDIVLPDLPGTEVFESLRADPITKAIPVLLLTAKPDIVAQVPAVREKSEQYRFLEKPGRIEDLLKIIQEMLTGK
ncbi:MAG: response regulator [Candidatus Omnitrophica bacterium]|nr:response regulator [Candidatus Omnitrophota bacterium]